VDIEANQGGHAATLRHFKTPSKRGNVKAERAFTFPKRRIGPWAAVSIKGIGMKIAKFPLITLTASALLFSGCVTTSELSGETVNRSYSPTGFNWTNGGALYMAVRVFNEGGQTAVCGAYAEDKKWGAARHEANQHMLDLGRIKVADETIILGLNFLHYSGTAENYRSLLGQPANCIVTSKEWKGEYARNPPKFYYPRKRVR